MDALRGPQFTAGAYEIERRMQREAIAPAELVKLFGEPDYRYGDESDGTFLYLFDHTSPELCRNEWWFVFANGRVVTSGFNWRGVNQWPDQPSPAK